MRARVAGYILQPARAKRRIENGGHGALSVCARYVNGGAGKLGTAKRQARLSHRREAKLHTVHPACGKLFAKAPHIIHLRAESGAQEELQAPRERSR